MLGLHVVLQIGLLLVLPQLAGLLITRLARRASWVAWPAAAIAVFGVVWRQWMWVPARDAAEQAEARCGMWTIGCAFILVVGLCLHLGAGALFAMLARRLRRPPPRARA